MARKLKGHKRPKPSQVQEVWPVPPSWKYITSGGILFLDELQPLLGKKATKQFGKFLKLQRELSKYKLPTGWNKPK